MTSVCFRFMGLGQSLIDRNQEQLINWDKEFETFRRLSLDLLKESHESVSFRLQKLEHSADAYV
jgi:hypothetical protein